MNLMKKLAVAAAVLALGAAVNVHAVDPAGGKLKDGYYSQEQPEGYENLWNRMSRKLGRGIVNAGFGVLEIPIRISEVNFNEGGLAALTFGTISGVGYFIAREFVGVFEIITFPIPIPGLPNDPYGYGGGYGPILMPEWVVSPENNYYNFFYTKAPFVH